MRHNGSVEQSAQARRFTWFEAQTVREGVPMKTVNVRGVIFGKGRPKIMTSLCGRNAAEMVEQGLYVKSLPVDVLEWRIDFLDEAYDIDSLVACGQKLRAAVGDETPILMTFRTAKEGGEKPVEPSVYADINTALAESGIVDLIDVEAFTGDETVQRIIAAAHKAGVFVVASNHDFEKTPAKEEIVSRLCKMQDLGADILKIALMPQCREDVLVLMDATRDMFENRTEHPLITMSMGGMGVVSRLAGESYGSSATFGAAAQASAPGQVGIADLARVLDIVHAGL